MAIQAKATVTLKGGAEVRKVLAGINSDQRKVAAESKRASAEQMKATSKAAREQERAARKASAEAKKAATDQERTAKQLTAAVAREEAKKLRLIEQAQKKAADAADKSAKAATRAAEREGAKQARIAEQTAKAQERAAASASKAAAREQRGRRIGYIAAGLAGTLAGVTSASNTARGIGGVASAEDRIRSANDMQGRMMLIANEAGLSPERSAFAQGQVAKASADTAIAPEQGVSALERAQQEFNALETFAKILPELAKASRAGAGDLDTLVGAMGAARQAYQLTDEQMMEAAHLMRAAGARGQIDAASLARDFASNMGIHAMSSGHKGMAGFSEFLGSAEGTGSGLFGSAESATRQARMLEDLYGDAKVQKELAKIGVHVRDKHGNNAPLASLVSDLANNKKFADPRKQSEIFPELRSRQGLMANIAAYRNVKRGMEGAVDIRSIQSLTAEEGRGLTDKGFAELQKTGGYKLDKQAVDMQLDTIANLETYNKQILLVNDASTFLEKHFRSLGLWAGAIAATGVAAVGSGMAARMMSGGGALGSGAAAAGDVAAGLGGVAREASAASRAIALLGKAAGVIGVFFAAYEGATALGADKLGEGIGNSVYDAVAGDPNGSWRTSAFDLKKTVGPAPTLPAGTVAAPASEQTATLRELREMNRHLSHIPAMDADLKANLQRPARNDSRGP